MRYLLAGVLAFGVIAVTAAEGADVRDLIKKLTDKDNDVRRNAAKDLGDIDGAKEAVPALRKAMADKDVFVRRFSAEALGKIGDDAKAAVPELTLAMKDAKKEVAVAAATALGGIGSAATDALTKAVKNPDQDPAVRRAAALGLSKIGLQARSAVPALTDVLTGKISNGKAKGKVKGKDKDADGNDIRMEVVAALGATAKPEDKEAVAALRSLSEDKSLKKNKTLKKAIGDSLKKIEQNGK